MKRTAIALLAASALAARAGEFAVPPIPELLAATDAATAQADAWKRWADDFSREMRTSMNAMFAGRMATPRLV